MLNIAKIEQAIDKMAMLKFFPIAPGTRAAIMELIGELCQDDSQVEWLAGRVVELYNEWPGPAELRAVYCSRWRPRRGPDSASAVYLEGIPSEKRDNMPSITAGDRKQISGPVSNDPSLVAIVDKLAAAKAMSSVTELWAHKSAPAWLRNLEGQK